MLIEKTTALADKTTALEDRTTALADRTTALADRTTALPDRTTALAAGNCDDLLNLGFCNNGVYDMVIGGRILPMYCKFGQGGYNWLVSINKASYYMNWK